MTGMRTTPSVWPCVVWIAIAGMLCPCGDAAAQETPRAPAAAEPAGDGRESRDRGSAAEPVISPDAREKFRAGVELSQRGRFEEAVGRFQEAYDLSKSYRILYNIGQVTDHLGDHARSLRALEQYLAEGAGKIDKGRRAEVQTQIATLRGQVGTLRIQVDPPGASVFVDEVMIGNAPFSRAYRVNPGVHRLRAEAAGRAPTAREFRIRAAQTVDLVLSLGATVVEGGSPQPAIAPAEARDPTPPSSTTRMPLWIGWAASGALVVGTGITGVLALATSAKLDDTPYEGRTPPSGSEVARLQDRLSTLVTVTNVLGVGAVIGLGVTSYFTLTQPSPASSTVRHRQTLTVGLGAQSISLGGEF